MNKTFTNKMQVTAGLLAFFIFAALAGWKVRGFYDNSSKYWEAEKLQHQLSHQYTGEDITVEKLLQIKDYPVLRDAEGKIYILVNNGFLLRFLERTQSITIEPIPESCRFVKEAQ